MKLLSNCFVFSFSVVFFATAVRAQARPDDSCYSPTPAGGTITGQWNAANAENFHNIQIPSDPAGGFVTMSLTANHPVLRTRIKVRDAVASGADIVVAQRGRDDNGLTRTSFEVSPNQSLRIAAGQYWNAHPNQYPVQYSLQWEFRSRVDCYEPNNSAAEAKEISIGQAITAYMLAGMDGNRLNTSGRNDWYQFTVDSERKLAVALLRLPSDIQFKLEVFGVRSNGTLETIRGLNLPKGNVAGGSDILTFQPGTYKIRVSAEQYGQVAVTNDQPLPRHFTQYYGLVIIPHR